MNKPTIEQIEKEIGELEKMISQTTDEIELMWWKSCLLRIKKFREIKIIIDTVN